MTADRSRAMGCTMHLADSEVAVSIYETQWAVTCKGDFDVLDQMIITVVVRRAILPHGDGESDGGL